MKINIHLVNVSVELLVAHEALNCPEASLARLDFNKSRLMYESYSDGSKDIDLVSHEILTHDTRYRGSTFYCLMLTVTKSIKIGCEVLNAQGKF